MTQKLRDISLVIRLLIGFLILALIANFFVIINAGHRGVLMRFGQVQPLILDEGIHTIIPIFNTVETLSVRVQKQEIAAEASSKDLQEVFTNIALNWHIIPTEVNLIYQEIGNLNQVVDRIINPAIEEVLKAVMAKYTAEEIITKREDVKTEVDSLLTNRLESYHILVDDISLVHIEFSQKFRDAVEAKQIAEQEAKRAEFLALKAIQEAQAKVNLAKGESEVQRLLKETLTPELLEKQIIDKWDGSLPLVISDEVTKIFDLSKFNPTNQEIKP